MIARDLLSYYPLLEVVVREVCMMRYALPSRSPRRKNTPNNANSGHSNDDSNNANTNFSGERCSRRR